MNGVISNDSELWQTSVSKKGLKINICLNITPLLGYGIEIGILTWILYHTFCDKVFSVGIIKLWVWTCEFWDKWHRADSSLNFSASKLGLFNPWNHSATLSQLVSWACCLVYQLFSLLCFACSWLVPAHYWTCIRITFLQNWCLSNEQHTDPSYSSFAYLSQVPFLEFQAGPCFTLSAQAP